MYSLFTVICETFALQASLCYGAQYQSTRRRTRYDRWTDCMSMYLYLEYEY